MLPILDQQVNFCVSIQPLKQSTAHMVLLTRLLKFFWKPLHVSNPLIFLPSTWTSSVCLLGSVLLHNFFFTVPSPSRDRSYSHFRWVRSGFLSSRSLVYCLSLSLSFPCVLVVLSHSFSCIPYVWMVCFSFLICGSIKQRMSYVVQIVNPHETNLWCFAT